jgi:UDP-N-acetylglucosamine 2-epimerase (non-hydrolysing)
VNSTLAAALAAVKLHIPIAHVEAGLRSGDRQMPEEINRILTDSIADLLFVTEKSGLDHLCAEGRHGAGVHLVGNVMIDHWSNSFLSSSKTRFSNPWDCVPHRLLC